MGDTRGNDPLRVLEVLAGLVVCVMTVVAVVAVAGTVVGTGTVAGLDTQVCATTSGDTPGFQYADGEATGPVGLRDGVTWSAQEVQLCDRDADGSTRALAGAGLVLWVGGPMLFFVLLWRFLRRARREGVYADRVPGQVRTLGRVLLAWAALDFVLSGWINGALLSRMTDSVLLFSASVSWVPVLLGIALLALAQVLAQGVDMRRDVEATI